jgi:diaminopimelate decarboxylase
MSIKRFPLSKERVEEIAREHPTPFHLYDEAAIRKGTRALLSAFSALPGFKEFFAVKALPNPYILKLLRSEGLGADCSSMTELLLAEKAGLRGEEIMFSSNDTPPEEFAKAVELGAIVNLDDISHIETLENAAGIPELVSCRYNPGPLKEGNEIIGKPEEAKYGFTRAQILEGFRILKSKGAKRFGLHTMVASNERNEAYFVETSRILFELAAEIARTLDIKLEFINLGGGIGIAYRPEQPDVDVFEIGRGVKEARDAILVSAGLGATKIFLECGRVITGPHGWLVSRVIHIKETYRRYAGLDASMANLMRPGMYGAYHHITVLGKEAAPPSGLWDVTGSLCENNDKFAIQRELPAIEIGDLVAIHDTGAHGHAMGFNYNGKLRSAELLLREDGSVEEIRRAERFEDLTATLDFGRLGAWR